MSNRLRNKVREYEVRVGDQWKEKLAIESKLSISTIVNVINGENPRPNNARKLALACGCSEEESIQIFEECSSYRAKETA